MDGLDYSAGQISGTAIRNAGYDFVIRYVDDPHAGLNSKHIRPDEFQDLVTNGVTCWLVFEVDISDMLGGFGQGQANARRARAGADWVGYPRDGVIFFACDQHLNASQIPVAMSYLDGCADVIGRDSVGVYGFWEVVDAAISQGKAPYRWQCGVAPDTADDVHIWQDNSTSTTVGGVACDVNRLLRPIGPAGPSQAPGGIEAMAFGDSFTDWGGNSQTVQSWMDHVDQRVWEMWNFLFTAGIEPSRIPGDANRTNGRDAVMDTVARVSVTKTEVEELSAKVDALSAALASVQTSAVDLDALALKVASHLAAAVSFTAK